MARLVRVRPYEDPGYRRVRSGSGFRFVDHTGTPVPERDAARARGLVIPPAWREVWIARDADAHIQVVGTDEAGRRQYTYHADWSKRRDKGKYARALQLAEALPRARARVTHSLRRPEDDRERVLAVSFRLLDKVAPRVGTARYFATNGSRGLTTLQRRDATVDGALIRLSFPAKSGKRAELSLRDEELAAAAPSSPRRRWPRSARWAARTSAREPRSRLCGPRPRRSGTLRPSRGRVTSTRACSRSTAVGGRWNSAGPTTLPSGA